MNLLAIDTSGRAAAFAAIKLDEEIGSVEIQGRATLDNTRQLAGRIITDISSTLDAAGWTLNDLDAIAVSLGPGSWTGLRVGVTAAKTLAQTRALPLVGVPVFDAVAQHIWRRLDDEPSWPEHCLLLVASPCRPGEIYGKIFECHPHYLAVVQAEWIGSPQMMADTLAAESLARGVEEIAVCSSAADSVGDIWAAHDEILQLPDVALHDIIVEIGTAGAALLDDGEMEDPLSLQPLYLAPSAAERNLIARGGLK